MNDILAWANLGTMVLLLGALFLLLRRIKTIEDILDDLIEEEEEE